MSARGGPSAAVATPMRGQESHAGLRTPARTPGGSEQTSATPVIDFARLEAAKENITRSAQGRSASALNSTLSLKPGARSRALAERAEIFEKECEAASAPDSDHDDPIEPWSRYAMWAFDAYPSHGPHLVHMLERATREFKGRERYAQDPRYLKLWVLYARACEKPQHVYQFLLAQEIGTNLATLYEELSIVYEGRGVYDQADATYKLGAARFAEPVDRLKKRYREFQARLTGRSQLAATAAAAGKPEPTFREVLAAAMASANRATLGERAPDSRGAGASSRSGNVARAFGSNTAVPLKAIAAPNNARQMDVFKDGDEGHGPDSKAPWDALPTNAERNQESGLGGSKLWHGEKLLQKPPARPLAAATPSKGAPLAVFRDSDDEDDEPKPRGGKAVSPAADPEAQMWDAANKLREDPLAHYDKTTKRALSVEEVQEARRKANQNQANKERRAARNKATHSHSVAGASANSSKPNAQPKATAASKGGEQYAVPLTVLYQGIDPKAPPDSGVDLSERSVPEVLAAQKGVQSSSGDPDPWSYLDSRIGLWLPTRQSESHVSKKAKSSTGSTLTKSSTSESLSRNKSASSAPAQKQTAEQQSKPKPPRDQQHAPATELLALKERPPRDAFDPDDSAANAAALGFSAPRRRIGNVRADQPTVTMATASALKEVNAFFNEAEEEDTDSDSESESDEDEDDLPPMSARRPPAMMAPSSRVVDETPTPATRSLCSGAAPAANSLKSRPPLGAVSENVNKETQPSEIAKIAGTVPSTPAKSALGGTVGETKKSVAVAPQLNPQPASRAQRIDISTLAEEEDEDEEEEDEEQNDGMEPDAAHPLDEHEYHHLTRVTEVTELTRFTMFSRTPGRSNSGGTSDAVSSCSRSRPGAVLAQHGPSDPAARAQPIAIDRAVVDQRGLPRLDNADADRSWNSNPSTEGDDLRNLSGSFDWARQRRGADVSPGHTIEQRAEDTSECFGRPALADTLVISDEEALKATGGIAIPVQGQQRIPNPCSPTDVEVVAELLAALVLPIESSPDFVDLSSRSAEGRLATLRKRAKLQNRKSISSGPNTPGKEWKLDIDGNPFLVRGLLGEGGFGSVFLAEDAIGGIAGDSSFEGSAAARMGEEDQEEDEEEAERRRLVAVKVESPANRLEFYILGQLRARLERKSLNSIVSARKCFVYQDESFLLLEYAERGTLLDMVNNAQAAGVAGSNVGGGGGGSGVDETLAMFFTIELLRLVEALHTARFVHGDVKIDNCLLRLDEPPRGVTWANTYSSAGQDGWSAKGITLIDFGRAIDLHLYPQGQTFLADWDTDEKDCPQMREGRPWTFEADYYGVASVSHCLLFGKYIETAKAQDNSDAGHGRYNITQTLRRYWQTDIWQEFFDSMLNVRLDDPSDPSAALDKLRILRGRMESWLESNACRGGRNLRGALKKVALYALKKSLARA
ncbi:protein kinase [Ceraceosorus bombacis]|uniref:Protein kinase n=1 Tax=Ceraceosorus bombacis TaxID=401625 RepID=A0A0P1BHX1_9BASI|nr:protein kinase [Ceraceosorus bombacis]